MSRAGDDVHVDLLVPWYVNGTLEADERARLEAHLETCGRCRDLLRQHGALEAGADSGSLEPAEHVPAELLVRYADAPALLDREIRAWIASRVARCQTCGEALARLQALEGALVEPAAATPARGFSARALWEALAGSVLRPIPALAYLLLLALLVPTIWLVDDEGSEGAPFHAPLRVDLAGERASRAPGGRIEPIELPATTGAPILLHLQTEMVPVDLDPARSRFVLALERDGRALWSEPRSAGDFLVDDGRVVLPLVLDPGRLRAGAVYAIVLRADRPGDPIDGQALFRRTFVLPEVGSAP